MAKQNVAVELFYSGAWADHTDDIYVRDAIKLTHGKTDAYSQAKPAECNLTFKSPNGEFNPANPNSALFGLIGRNTPLRVGFPPNGLRLDGGGYASTPDTATLDITGDIEIRAWLAADNWTGSFQALVSKWEALTGDNQSFLLRLESDATLAFFWTTDGTDGTQAQANSDAALPFPPGAGFLAVRVTVDVDNGSSDADITFAYADDIDATTWTQLGTVQNPGNTISLFSGTAPVVVGSQDISTPPGQSTFIGRVRGVHVYDGIAASAGTIAANPDFTAEASQTASFADSTGKTWTVAADAEIAPTLRFAGEAASFKPRRAIKGDAWVEVTAYGISHRLGQGATPLRSAMATEIPTRAATGQLGAYWPCEDGPRSTQVAPGLVGLSPMAVSGDVEMGASSPLVATSPLPQLNDGSLSAAVPPGFRTIAALVEVPVGGLTDNALLYRMSMSGGDVAHSELRYRTNNGGQVQVTLVDSDGTSNTGASSTGGIALDGGLWVITFTTFLFAMTGATFALGNVMPVADDGSLGAPMGYNGTSLASTSPGTIYATQIGGGLGGGVVGHVAISTADSTSVFPYDAQGTTTAYLGEPAGDRVERLCAQNDIAVTLTGTAGDTKAMGPQAVGTLLSLLRECADADGGILGDAVTEVGLSYRTGRSLYNQDPALTLDWDADQIAPPLEPVSDDLTLRNDVTIRRSGGSSARAVQQTGALSVQDPPDGVGRYDTSDEVNVPGDGGFLESQAGWRLHLGTSTETRFPRVTVDLDAAPTLASTVAVLRPGDRLELTNLPDDVSVDDVSLLILGWTESIGSHRRKITFNCTPERPYRIAEVGGGPVLGTVGAEFTTLNEALDGTETAVDIDCGGDGPWVHEGVDYDIVVGGERMTVTAVGAASGTFPAQTQTLTVTRAVNGVTKTHSDGDPVAMADPVYIGL